MLVVGGGLLTQPSPMGRLSGKNWLEEDAVWVSFILSLIYPLVHFHQVHLVHLSFTKFTLSTYPLVTSTFSTSTSTSTCPLYSCQALSGSRWVYPQKPNWHKFPLLGVKKSHARFYLHFISSFQSICGAQATQGQSHPLLSPTQELDSFLPDEGRWKNTRTESIFYRFAFQWLLESQKLILQTHLPIFLRRKLPEICPL